MNDQQSTRSTILAAVYTNLKVALLFATFTLGALWYMNELTFDAFKSITVSVILLSLYFGIRRGGKGQLL